MGVLLIKTRLEKVKQRKALHKTHSNKDLTIEEIRRNQTGLTPLKMNIES